MPGTTATDTSEMLKEKLVIPLKTDLSTLLGRYQALHGSPVPETQAGTSSSSQGCRQQGEHIHMLVWRSQDRQCAVCSRTDASITCAKGIPSQCLCNGQSAQAKCFLYVMAQNTCRIAIILHHVCAEVFPKRSATNFAWGWHCSTVASCAEPLRTDRPRRLC